MNKYLYLMVSSKKKIKQDIIIVWEEATRARGIRKDLSEVTFELRSEW